MIQPADDPAAAELLQDPVNAHPRNTRAGRVKTLKNHVGRGVIVHLAERLVHDEPLDRRGQAVTIAQFAKSDEFRVVFRHFLPISSVFPLSFT